MKTQTFTIASVVSTDCVTLEDGNKLYEAIFPLLKDGTQVILDFANVSVYATPFFNAGIGKLLADFTPEDLRERLLVRNLDPSAFAVIQRVIEHAKDYYSDPKYREAMLDALNDITRRD